jgi:beta-lactam-binding protein with PASTA domain
MATTPEVMPKVWDLSFNEAQRALQSAGLDFTIVRMQSRVIPAGAVIGVSPRPGTPLDDEVRIIITISIGPPVVPNQDADS